MIDEIKTFTFLRIVFNSKLTWIYHTDMIKVELSKSVGIIRRFQYIFWIFSNCYAKPKQ